MKKKDVKVGIKVTCLNPEEAYYSNYAGNPICCFMPGDIGIVGAIDVPYVMTKNGKDKFFVCVDFEKDGQKWRVGIDYDNLKEVT